ncbi:MAG: rhodanese-like domain-containing protein, partial [Alphaproteobacteria bacterium]
MSTRRLALLFIFLIGAAGGATLVARTDTVPAAARIAPETAFAAAQAGKRLLIDLRTPAEWRETGVATNAVTLDFNASGGGTSFVGQVLALVDGDRSRPVALICARGNRSGRAWRLLHDAGFGDVKDVAEGMLGNDLGPGWLGRGLPTT